MKRWQFRLLVGAVIVLWAAWLLQYPIFTYLRLGWSVQTLGPWGDTFGALNALFAAAACVGVIATLRMQSKELERQQLEIEKADRERKLQRFEGTFFQLLALLRELKSEVNFKESVHHPANHGHAGLAAANNVLQRALAPSVTFNQQVSADMLSNIYAEEVYRQAEATLGPYFRIIYSILRRISETDFLDGSAKAAYGNLVRSQLSSPEISLIAANGLTEASNDFRKYIVEFRILKYTPKNGYRSILEKIYPKEAFAPRD